MTDRAPVGATASASDGTRSANSPIIARQDLPSRGSLLPPHRDAEDATGFFLLCWGVVVRDSAVALGKSTEIAARGAQVLNAAWFASAWMGIEDVFDVQRTRLTYCSTKGLLRQERDFVLGAVTELSRRNAVLGRIWIQVLQDFSHPLQQQTALACEGLWRLSPGFED